MKNLNKILFLFLFLISISLVSIWETLQSEWVAKKVSFLATKYAKEVLNSDIQFVKLNFKLFPPATEIEEVKLSFKKDEVSGEVELEKLGMYFNPLDVFNTKFTIDNVKLSDGRINIINNVQNNKKKEISNINLNFLDNLPLNFLELIDLEINYQDINVDIKELLLENKKDKIRVSGVVNSFEQKLIDLSKLELDEIKFDFVLDQYKIDINKVTLRSGLSTANIKGKVSAYLSNNISYNLDLNSSIPAASLHDYLSFEQIGKVNSGIINTKANIKGGKSNFEVNSENHIEELVSDFITAKKAEIQWMLNKDELEVKSIKIRNDSGELSVQKSFQLYDFNTKKFVEDPIYINSKNFEIRNALSILRNKFDLLNGNMTGGIVFNLYESSYDFVVSNEISVKEFKIKNNENSILDIGDLELKKAVFVIKNSNFKMNLRSYIGESEINLNGEISKDKFNIEIPTSFIKLNTIKSIFGHEVLGSGTFGLNIDRSNKDKYNLKLSTDLKDFEMLDYKLKKVKAAVNYNLDSNKLSILNLEGLAGKTLISTVGEMDFENNEISLDYKVRGTSYFDLKKSMSPIFGNIGVDTKKILGRFDVKGRVFGGLNLNTIRVDGLVSGNDIYIYDEGFDSLSFSFNVYGDKNLGLKSIIAKKSGGSIYGYSELNIQTGEIKFWSDLKEIPIQDLNLYNNLPLLTEGTLNGKFSGVYNRSLSFKSNIVLKDTSVENVNYSDSKISLVLDDNLLNVDANIFDGEIKIKTDLHFDDKVNSRLAIDINISDFNRTLKVFKGIDTENRTLKGNLNYSMSSVFSYKNFRFVELESNLKSLVLSKYPVEIDYKNTDSEIILKDGKVLKWNLNVRNRGNYIISVAKGEFPNDFISETRLKIHASLLEVFNPYISKANGDLRGLIKYSKTLKDSEFEAIAKSSNLSLTTKFLPTAITKSNLEIKFEKGKLIIKRFIANLVSGEFIATGDIDFKKVIPEVNIRYKFENAGIVLLKKSTLEFSGEGALIGKRFPYVLGGDFYIQKFVVNNEITDFGDNGESIVEKDIEYLPKNKGNIINQYLKFNLNLFTRDPVYLKNSLADIGMTGNLQVLGGESDIRLNGSISLAPRRNTLNFKNNTFQFSKGIVYFSEDSKLKNPELNIVASSTINDYRIAVEVLGPVEKFKVNLSSEPSLAQSDILSLIAFGYTEDLSSNLTESERESMTQAGVGSLIFETFKINETLKNEFGLELNLGTEISQAEGSFLSRRNTESNTGDTRVNSATKLELTKKVNDAMSLSVSSTVGNSTQQRQSINLNYNIDDNISVEGVYETRSTDDVQAIDIDTSFGTDVKWKWSFK